jgi:hypothetical protein
VNYTSQSSTGATASGSTRASTSRYRLSLDGSSRDDLLSALRTAATTLQAELACPACAVLLCHEEQHQPHLAQIRAWRHLAAGIARQPATGLADEPLIRFDADACRTWLLAGAAETAGIGIGSGTANLTITAGLDELLALLNTDVDQQAWITAPHVHEVLIWRTADDDGIDGGGVLTVDLNYLGERVRLASLHQGYDDFTTDTAASGIDVAVEALAHVAATVNREYTTFCRATAVTADSDRDAEHTHRPDPDPGPREPDTAPQRAAVVATHGDLKSAPPCPEARPLAAAWRPAQLLRPGRTIT